MTPETPGSWLATGSWKAWKRTTIITLVLSSLLTPFANAAALGERAGGIANGIELKILAIGDSITYGAGDPFCPPSAAPSNCNGYRKPLYEDLKASGNEIEFVGSKKAGDFDQNACEGHRGERISEIQKLSSVGIWAEPNIVLLHAGTNDIFHEDAGYANVENDLKELVSLIFDRSPDTLLFLCTIIPANPDKAPKTAKEIPEFNKKVSKVYNYFKDQSKNIVLVDMNSELEVADISDNLHPNNGGYDKMAKAFAKAIRQSEDKISKAGKGSEPPTSTNPDNCRATPSWFKTGEIAKGAKIATTDGGYIEARDEKRLLTKGFCLRSHARLMDLDGDGVKDYACVDPDTGRTRVWRNKGSRGKISDEWEDEVEVATGGAGRKGNAVMFADLNGDGRDDYIYVNPRNGYVYAWINQGKQGDKYLWEDIGLIASGVTATHRTLQLVDLDGDGRADFCMVNLDTGEVTGWLNRGVGKVPEYYRIPDFIATGDSKGEDDYVFLTDFTGEGRADYVLVHKNGDVTGFINRRNSDSVAPRWSFSVPVVTGVDEPDQDAVRMIDMDGDGKADYVGINHQGAVTMWRNKSTGGKYQKGDGVFLCDLDGDGAMDYFWVDHEGKGWGYLNVGKGEDVWHDLGPIAKTGGKDRRQIRMAVLTKSKRADYVVVDDDTGRAEWWQNLGPSNDYDWAHRGVAAEGPAATLKQKFGWEPFYADNVRFADLNDDGFDDYIYIHEDKGAVAWFENTGVADKDNGPQWRPPLLVADGVGVAPRDIQFANTDGKDGLDYVTVGRIDGKATTWHNLGFRENAQGERSIRWNTPLPFADGTAPGQTIRLADMTGDGRADYVAVDPETGSLTLWHNRCWPTGDDDDDDNDDNDDSDDKFPWEERHVNEFCGALASNGGLSPEEKSYIWGSEGRGLGVGEWLDREIGRLKNKENDWLKMLKEDKRNEIDTEKWDQWTCDSIYNEAQCDFTDLGCKHFFSKNLAPLWWVARATSGLHSWITSMTAELERGTLENALAIEGLIAELGHAEEDTQAFDIFITVLGAAGAATSASTPVSAGISGLSSFLTLMNDLSPSDEANDRLMAEGVLGMLFTSSMRTMRALLHLAIKGVYSDDDEMDVGKDEEMIEDRHRNLTSSDLPRPDKSSYSLPTAQFYQDGQWLLDWTKMESNAHAWGRKYARMGKQAIGMALLKDQHWFVFINEENDNLDKCEVKDNEGKHTTARRWVNGMCGDLWVFLEDDSDNTRAEAARDEERTKFDALQSNATVILADMYENAIDCALNFPDGDGTASTINFTQATGEYPTCFFNIPVVRGSVLRYGQIKSVGSPQSVPFINTSERKRDEWGDEI